MTGKYMITEHTNVITVKKSLLEKKLRQHIESHKTTECQNCGIVITKNSTSSHKIKCLGISNKIAYECDQCQYKTEKKHSLKCHETTHIVKEKVLHPCTFCDKSFELQFQESWLHYSIKT